MSGVRDEATSARWASPPLPAPSAPVRLFCLPYAGAGASAYRDWVPELQARAPVEAVPIQLPGRESRLRERPTIDLDEMTRAVLGRLDRPYAVFGHSLGGRLAYELCRRLRGLGAPPPRWLYVSGCPAPHIVRNRRDSDLPDEDFIARIVGMGGTPHEVFADEELRELVLTVMRADFAFVDNYRCLSDRPIDAPITAFVGSDDEEATPHDAADWRRHTSRAFALHVLAGGHFFLHEHRAALISVIADDLLHR
jgi:surfactin synthase thioesterase subunit